jgi:ADP-heptose:LPS heptosyltransferase
MVQTKLFVGIDSVPLHITAYERTPSVALCGLTLPHLFYAPEFPKEFVASDVECQGYFYRRPRVDWVTGCPNDILCIKTLPVEKVLRARPETAK